MGIDMRTHRPHDITEPHCMSCHVGEHCQYVDAKFSPTGLYYIEQCLGPGIPQYTLRHPLENESPGKLYFYLFTHFVAYSTY